MLKKLFSLIIIILIIAFAWLGDVVSVSVSPFSVTIRSPEKDFLKRVAKKVSGIVYREATVHNPPGDLVPDQIDNNLKEKIKDVVN
jgi:hypothetical protein